MKKRITLVVAVLMLAAPVLARVDIGCTCDGNEVTVSYVDQADPNRVRAFALDITVDDANIVSVSGYKVGESVQGDKGYGIFPGSIVIVDGEVDSNGTPDCNGNEYPGTLPGLGSNGVTFELGSLYVGGPNAPDPCGVLFKFIVDGSCTVDINENTIRGGVVLEDPDVAADPNFTGCAVVLDCLYVGRVFAKSTVCINAGEPDLTVTQAMVDKWVYLGKPDCWCCEAQKCGNGAYGGASAARVDIADLAALKLSWFKRHTQAGYNPCVDFDMSGRVDIADLSILKRQWFTRPGTCP